MAKIYPSKFYGNAIFFNAVDRAWYVACFMPFYRGTLWTLLSGILWIHDRDGFRFPEARYNQPSTDPDALLAAIVQVGLYTVPKAKKSYLISHNDLKIDNIAYRKTSKRYIYVRIKIHDSPPILLAIPTHGRLFTLFDFGWASLSCEKENLFLCSTCPYDNLDSQMDAWNPCTDFAQIAYSICYGLQYEFEKEMAEMYTLPEEWWDVIDAVMLIGSTDGGAGVLNINADNWNEGFYSESSKKCHFRSARALVSLAAQKYRCTEDAIPKNRAVLEYDASILENFSPIVE
jgi:hypothetical protein